MIKDDLIAGHIPCGECDDFTHIVRASVVASLPDGYTGELCPTCSMWMCRLDKIGQKAEAVNSEAVNSE